MPTRARRTCNTCGTPTTGSCPVCTKRRQQRTDAARPTAPERGYDHHWRTVTKPRFLARNPWCVDCGEPSEVPDHDPETRRELVARGVANPDADEYLRPRCLRCHARKTVTHDGGLGNPRRGGGSTTGRGAPGLPRG